MFKQTPFPLSIIVLFVLILLHLVGSYYSLYWVFPWYDIIVHVVAGLWVSLLFLWLATILGEINSFKEYKTKTFLIAFVAAILIGVVWELVENLTQVTFVRAESYYVDTALDILNGGFGAVLAYFYFTRNKKCPDHSVDIVHPFYSQTGIIKV
jgi:hypothetical protein